MEPGFKVVQKQQCLNFGIEFSNSEFFKGNFPRDVKGSKLSKRGNTKIG